MYIYINMYVNITMYTHHIHSSNSQMLTGMLTGTKQDNKGGGGKKWHHIDPDSDTLAADRKLRTISFVAAA
jgi:hypothetical protein